MKNAPALALLKVAVLALGLFGGARDAGAAEVLARGTATARPASSVSLATALDDAHRLASRKGDTVVRVEGVSMLPYFGEGSVLVVRAAAVDALKAGMVVVYRNRFGETVAHRVEARTSEGWTVRGANNTATDSTVVNASNLVGTVYATFYSDPRGGAEAVSLAGLLAAKTPVALAASAR